MLLLILASAMLAVALANTYNLIRVTVRDNGYAEMEYMLIVGGMWGVFYLLVNL